jgi:hypothetical protein
VSQSAKLQRLPWATGSDTRTFMVQGSLVDEAPDVELSLGVLRSPLWDVPLPPCPDCGGTLAWTRPGNAPAAQRCRVCGSLFRVMVE